MGTRVPGVVVVVMMPNFAMAEVHRGDADAPRDSTTTILPTLQGKEGHRAPAETHLELPLRAGYRANL